MSNMIKKVSRDHENYEVNSADKIMVYNRLGKLYTDEDLKKMDADELAVIKKRSANDMNAESNGIDDIIIRNSCYYESRFAGDYRFIRRIIRIEGQRVADWYKYIVDDYFFCNAVCGSGNRNVCIYDFQEHGLPKLAEVYLDE